MIIQDGSGNELPTVELKYEIIQGFDDQGQERGLLDYGKH